MKDIVIVGSGGFAKEVAFLIDEINKVEQRWNILGFVDNKEGGYNGKYKIIGNDDWLIHLKKKIAVVFAIGTPQLAERIQKNISVNKYAYYPNLIHPNVIGDWQRIKIGKGNVICASNIFTTDIKIGDFNIINLDCTLGHDCEVGDFNILNPSVNVSGGVRIGSLNLIGTNSTILQNKTISNEIIIGGSSLVTKDVLEKGVYVGQPIRKM